MFPHMSSGDDPRLLLTNKEWLNGTSKLLEPSQPAASALPLLNVGRLPFACQVKNASGAAVVRYGILGIDSVIITKTDADKTFWGPTLQLKGVKPKQAHAGRTAHCLGPIDDGRIGQAIIPNAIQCQVDVVSATDRFASLIDDDLVKLKSGATGHYPFIPAETGTGVKWGIVFLVGAGGGACEMVLITSSVSAAGYNTGTKKLAPASFIARQWVEDGPDFTHSADKTKDCTNPYRTAITVTAGKGRVAWVTSSGRLISVDCEEFTL